MGKPEGKGWAPGPMSGPAQVLSALPTASAPARRAHGLQGRAVALPLAQRVGAEHASWWHP